MPRLAPVMNAHLPLTEIADLFSLYYCWVRLEMAEMQNNSTV